MKRSETVARVMTSNPVTVSLANRPSEVRALFGEHGFHHLPVVSGDELYGLISFADLARVTWGDAARQDARALDAFLDHTTTIESFLTRDVVTVSSKEPVRRAAELLSDGRFHALPVVDDGKLVGIVTTTDLIRYLLTLY